MKKDIQIPEVTNVEMAVVYEYNDLYNTDDWNVYIINNKNVDLEMVVIVTQGFSDTKITCFHVTFFEGNTLFEKTFIFKENTIKEGSLRMIDEIKKRGILA